MYGYHLVATGKIEMDSFLIHLQDFFRAHYINFRSCKNSLFLVFFIGQYD